MDRVSGAFMPEYVSAKSMSPVYRLKTPWSTQMIAILSQRSVGYSASSVLCKMDRGPGLSTQGRWGSPVRSHTPLVLPLQKHCSWANSATWVRIRVAFRRRPPCMQLLKRTSKTPGMLR